ncbi:MAG: Ig-like domain-containing protein [Candidatus Thermoplasmatota archaeon]
MIKLKLLVPVILLAFFINITSVRVQANDRPSVEITTPLDKTEVSGIVCISGKVYDEDSLAMVEVKINNGSWDWATTFFPDWYYFWNVTDLPMGKYQIYARAFDGTSYSLIVSRTYYVVARIEGIVMTEHAVLAADVTLRGRAFDGTEVNHIQHTDALGMFTITWSIPGIYNLTVSREGYKSQTITNLNFSTGKIWCEDGYYAGYTFP